MTNLARYHINLWQFCPFYILWANELVKNSHFPIQVNPTISPTVQLWQLLACGVIGHLNTYIYIGLQFLFKSHYYLTLSLPGKMGLSITVL